MKKLVYIMRGVPGSGKSAAAQGIAGGIGVVHSVNDYFYKDGIYCPDEDKLKGYQEQNFNAFCESLQKEVPVVICDNVNQRYEDFRRYQHEAIKAGYVVALVTMPHPYPPNAAARNIHGASEEYIRWLIERWEL